MTMELITGAGGCLHSNRETMVVGFAAGCASALSVIIAILYLFKSSGQIREEPASAAPVKSSKLMLVEVQGNSTTATVHNPRLQLRQPCVPKFDAERYWSSPKPHRARLSLVI